MKPRISCTSTTWRLAVVLRAWFVALLAFPALGVGASLPAEAALEGASTALEAVVRAGAPLPDADGKPADAAAAGEPEEEEDASKRDGLHARGTPAEHGIALAAVRAFDCTAPELRVPCTPQLECRLHNRGPPRA